ncbi:MAG TPA: HAD-IA family hydrolase [Candidatus Saccharimonadales bacterium]|nr:HAD-IA family hydrolase [Candidatus Saccharimonadales bacterium]
MIKAVIFDFFGVIEKEGEPNEVLLTYIRTKLKPRYKIAIISNALADFIPEILSQEDINLFDDIVISHRVGVAKPEPAIYEISLGNLGVRANEAVFTDDTEVFCVAARSLGMQAILYENFEQTKNDLEQLLQ